MNRGIEQEHLTVYFTAFSAPPSVNIWIHAHLVGQNIIQRKYAAGFAFESITRLIGVVRT